MTNSIDKPLSDLDWLAFWYVSGEMTDAERDAFELQMADDVEACESVARMTRLALAARSVLSEQLPVFAKGSPAKPVVRSAWSAVFVATSALALLLAVFAFSRNFNTDVPVETAGNLEQTATLVSHWSDATDESDDEGVAYREEESTSFADSELPEVPGWMLAAVSLEQPKDETEISPDANDPEPELQDN